MDSGSFSEILDLTYLPKLAIKLAAVTSEQTKFSSAFIRESMLRANNWQDLKYPILMNNPGLTAVRSKLKL